LGCPITSSALRFHYHSQKVIGSLGLRIKEKSLKKPPKKLTWLLKMGLPKNESSLPTTIVSCYG